MKLGILQVRTFIGETICDIGHSCTFLEETISEIRQSCWH